MRVNAITRAILRRDYYSIPEAGAKVGLGRTQSYEAERRKQIPTKRVNGLRLVKRRPWDRKVKRLLESKLEAAPPEASTTTQEATV
jgi:hypothetical protein